MSEALHTVTFLLNGQPVSVRVPARRSLADALRDNLGLTGTHLGCEQGACGACTVLLEGRAVRSCLLLAVQVDGQSVVTVEGLTGPDGSLHVLQDAFFRHHAFQCGFCTPGFLLTASQLMATPGSLTEEAVREALSGNLCRCTGYEAIVQAVLSLKGEGGER